MARRGSITSVLKQIAAQEAKRAREAEQARKRVQREQERVIRENQRQIALDTKEAKIRYIASREEEVLEQNDQIIDILAQLGDILNRCNKVTNKVDFEKLKRKETFPPFIVPASEVYNDPQPQLSDFTGSIQVPNKVTMLVPSIKKKYLAAIAKAELDYQQAVVLHQKNVLRSEQNIAFKKENYEKEKDQFIEGVRQHNLEVDELKSLYESGDEEAISAYCTLVLEQSEYPNDFSKEFQLVYIPASREVVVEYELPPLDVIPSVSAYKYIKTRDEIQEIPQKPVKVKDLYQDIVSSVCLRTIHELFESDQGNWIDVVSFNGFTSSVDPSTGKDTRPCLISARTSKEVFSEINLHRIDKRACLKNLGAQVSPRPDEMLAIKPVVNFDMVDKRFVQSSDVLSDLDSRPNIMDLSPFEFELLVTNLFSGIGFETKQTRSSRDGGVDAIAFDSRPLLGGKIILQAKRYKNVVGVSAVRDLYGTMINEGANKGILVTTSHYGPDAYTFANDKPIELIDGSGLLYLLKNQGVEAKIIVND